MAYKTNKTIYLSNNKPVGRIENGQYRSSRNTKKHFFRSKPGWAISCEILNLLIKEKVEVIVLEVKADSGAYEAKSLVADFAIHGVELNYGDKQLLLLDRFWSQQKPTQMELINENKG